MANTLERFHNYEFDYENGKRYFPHMSFNEYLFNEFDQCNLVGKVFKNNGHIYLVVEISIDGFIYYGNGRIDSFKTFLEKFA